MSQTINNEDEGTCPVNNLDSLIEGTQTEHTVKLLSKDVKDAFIYCLNEIINSSIRQAKENGHKTVQPQDILMALERDPPKCNKCKYKIQD